MHLRGGWSVGMCVCEGGELDASSLCMPLCDDDIGRPTAGLSRSG